MMTLRRSAPSPTITCLSRSWVRGRENFTPASSMAMALASAGPIQIGSTRSPSRSCRITTGVLVVRSSPRWATRTSITSSRASVPLGPEVPRGPVFLLFRRQRVGGRSHRLQLESSDLSIQVARDAVHLAAQRLGVLDDELRCQGLVGEGHVHDT